MWEMYYILYFTILSIHRQVWFVERLLLHKSDANNVLSTAITYRSVLLCIVYHTMLCASRCTDSVELAPC